MWEGTYNPGWKRLKREQTSGFLNCPASPPGGPAVLRPHLLPVQGGGPFPSLSSLSLSLSVCFCLPFLFLCVSMSSLSLPPSIPFFLSPLRHPHEFRILSTADKGRLGTPGTITHNSLAPVLSPLRPDHLPKPKVPLKSYPEQPSPSPGSPLLLGCYS